MKELGFETNRLRVHGDIARVEIPKKDFGRFMELQETITGRLKSLGFIYITLDLEAFRSGSMDIHLLDMKPSV